MPGDLKHRAARAATKASYRSVGVKPLPLVAEYLVQPVVEILASQKSRRTRDHASGGQGPADEFASVHPTLLLRLGGLFLHGVLLSLISEICSQSTFPMKDFLMFADLHIGHIRVDWCRLVVPLKPPRAAKQR
jgi:hypothetical protein